MKKIYLTGKNGTGKFALVDNKDFIWLSQYRWWLNSDGFPLCRIKRKLIKIHRLIMKPSDELQVDHINGDRLDNRQKNLRICNGSQNCANRIHDKRINRYGYKGVYKRDNVESETIWRAKIRVNQKYLHLGVFETSGEAALAYNQAALKYFGEFARLNQI